MCGGVREVGGGGMNIIMEITLEMEEGGGEGRDETGVKLHL